MICIHTQWHPTHTCLLSYYIVLLRKMKVNMNSNNMYIVMQIIWYNNIYLTVMTIYKECMILEILGGAADKLWVG